MCGIVGVLAMDSRARVSPDALIAMRDAMAHRGPDGIGLWVAADGRVGLGHRRLAIIDLSEAANQPMRSTDGRYYLTYNGEIYNHADIRRELIGLGRTRWQTDHSDTEVILQAFEQWGIDCLTRFRGMFAFGLWDAQERRLWLARDRVGIKPLYYGEHHGRFAFASEIKALLADPEQPRAVDEAGLFHYLSFLTTPAPNTLFAGIHKLPAATWMRVEADGRTRTARWWDPWDHVTPLKDASEAEIAARVLEELRAAVRLHKVSDVPVGVFLSGGVDSSTNATLFAEGNSEIRTFSIGYTGSNKSYPSELPQALQVAHGIGAMAASRELNYKDLSDFLPRMIELQDEPLGDPVCVPLYYVSKLARDNGIKVAQVGEGADELFLGYPGWIEQLRAERWFTTPAWSRRMMLAAFEATGQGDRGKVEWLRRSLNGQPTFWYGAQGLAESQKQRLLSASLRQRLDGLTSWSAIEPMRQEFEAKAWDPSPANWMTYADLNFRLPELLLMRVDKMSMGAGIETRVPFLDHKLVELALSIPSRLRWKGGQPKWILKRAVRGVVPDAVIDRPKQGFGIPMREWFELALRRDAGRKLRQFCSDTGYFEWTEIERMLAAGQAEFIWYALNFSEWWRRWIA